MLTGQTALKYTFNGSLTKTDSKTYHPYRFDVPEGATNIHINFTFSPAYATGRIHRNQINVSLNDTDGIRGVWNVIRPEGFNVNGVHSSPGFGSWPLQPGTWTAFVDSHRVLPPDTVHYELTVTITSEPLTISAPVYEQRHTVARGEAGWYRGDLHGHTIHSDGRWDIPEFTDFLRNTVGLDFVSLSDHNTVTGLAQHRSQTEPGFLAIGGMELSTFNGHMLALGSSNLYEWRLNITEGMDISRIMQQVIDAGDMLIIAHPMSPDEPFCSGCLWQFEDARPGVALGVEIWNGYWHPFNEEALQQYYVWLNMGNRLVATSGTDIHGRPPAHETGRRAGFNVIYAEELSEAAILIALRKGHSYVSAGPELRLTAQTASGQTAMMGDALPAEGATIRAEWAKAPSNASLNLIVNGSTRHTQTVGESGTAEWSLASGEANWCLVELRDPWGLWAVTNPIFFGPFNTGKS